MLAGIEEAACTTRGGSRGAPTAPRRVAGGQPERPHRLAVGDRHRVELQVQLGREVERHLLGPLRLDDYLVLAEVDAPVDMPLCQ